MYLIVSFQSSDFLHTQPCIQLSVIVAKCYPFLYHYILYSHFETRLRFLLKPNTRTAKKAQSLTPIQRNDKVVITVKIISGTVRVEISSISLKIYGKIKERFPEIVVATVLMSNWYKYCDTGPLRHKRWCIAT